MSMSNDAPTAWGLPPIEQTSPLIQQGYDNTCAVRCQQLILQDFGITVSEEELANLAVQKRWFSDGTPQDCVGNLLDYYGVQTSRTENGNIFSLTSELAQGHRVIVAVDSGELWNPGWKEQLNDIFGSAPDHALIVAGIDTSVPDNITVQLMDPGTGEIAAGYPVEQFIDAWKDSDCQMVATTEPPPPWAFGMNNFDYSELLHVPFIGQMPYGEFERFSALPDQQAGDKEFATNFIDEMLLCIKGEKTIPEMLENLFGDNAPCPPELALPDDIRNEVSLIGNGEYAADAFDNAAMHSDWADEYSDLSKMYADQGDYDTASWYAEQAATEEDEAEYYNDQGMDELDNM